MKILIIGSEGYIGSRLKPYLRAKGYHVEGVDIGYYNDTHYKLDYGAIAESYYNYYDTIILLAGHSSPSLSENDINGSFKNNVVNFQNLLSKLKPKHRLLYASSASVCNGLANAKEDTKLNAPINNYDMQKQAIEMIASVSEIQTVGMRLGTIGGYSSCPRLDSIINSVHHDGINKKEVIVSNGSNMRSYLGMNDMCKSVEALINLANPEKIYNIASGTTSISSIAYEVSYITNAHITNKEGDSNYSFWVNCDKINKIVEMTDTIESICADMGDMPTKDKNIYNRNTNLFKY